MYKCKRCGKELTSEESIKRGYGDTCFRIVTFHHTKKWRLILRKGFNTLRYKKKGESNLPVMENFVSEVNFLKCEINMFKRQLRELKTMNFTTTNNVVNYNKTVVHQDIVIERIKQEESAKVTDPIIKQYRNVFRDCVKDLKEVLKKGKGYLKEPEPYEPEIIGHIDLVELKSKNKEFYAN